MEPDKVIVLPEAVFVYKPYEETMREVFIDNNISPVMVDILIAQARHETGNFTSSLFVNHNNLWGMQHPRTRHTTSTGPLATADGGRKGYAHYESIEDSARDMVLYLKARRIPDYTTVAPYVKHLKRKGYFEDSLKKYTRSLERYV